VNRTQPETLAPRRCPPPTLRPACPGDEAGLAAMLAGLSPQSFYQRFLSGGGELSARLRAQLVHATAERGAWLAVAGDVSGDVSGHVSGESVVGHACWVFEPGTPADRPVAELAAVVADGWQGRGLGARLLAAVARDATDAGADAVQMYLLANNRRLLARIGREWPDVRPRRDGTLVVYQVPAEAVVPWPTSDVA
jgi:GNAT superfamily N-acetyltransferase